MRTECYVEGQEVVAISLKHQSVLAAVSLTPSAIRRAILASGMGKVEVKPFQHSKSTTNFIACDCNYRVQCAVIYLAKLQLQMSAHLKVNELYID